MSQQVTNQAIDYFGIAKQTAGKPDHVITSGVIPLNVILEVAFSAKAGTTFTAMGLKELATSIQHLEKKIDLIMKKLGIPNPLP